MVLQLHAFLIVSTVTKTGQLAVTYQRHGLAVRSAGYGFCRSAVFNFLEERTPMKHSRDSISLIYLFT